MTEKNGKDLAAASFRNVQARRRKGYGGAERAAMADAIVASRRYKPTSSLAIGTKLDMASKVRDEEAALSALPCV
eukprot:SAG11_NODE_175_length_13457_cov_42.095673_6_plen_75_part_00